MAYNAIQPDGGALGAPPPKNEPLHAPNKTCFSPRNKEICGIAGLFVVSFLTLSALSFKKVGSFSKLGEKGAIGFLSSATISAILGGILCRKAIKTPESNNL